MSVSIDAISRFLLRVCVLIALTRGANLGFGYPSDQNELGDIDYSFQRNLQYLLLVLTAAYVLWAPREVLRWLQTISPITWVTVCGLLLTTVLSLLPIVSFRALVALAVVSLPILFTLDRFGPAFTFSLVRQFCAIVLLASLTYGVLFPHYAFMSGGHEGALRGLFDHKNYFGAFAALSTVILYRPYRYKFDLWWFGSLALCLLAAIMAVMSKSASALLMLIATVSTTVCIRAVLTTKGVNSKLLMLGAYSGAAIIGAFALALGLFESLLESLDRDPTLTGRVGLWEVLGEVILERPLTGFGLGTFAQPEVIYAYSVTFGWEAKTTHNSFVDLYLATGIIVASIFLTLIARGIVDAALSTPRTRGDLHRMASALGLMVGLFLNAAVGSGVFLAASFQWMLLLAILAYAQSQTRPGNHKVKSRQYGRRPLPGKALTL